VNYPSFRRCSMTQKRRRNYSQEFKEEAVKLVTEQGYSITVAARSLEINASMLRRWKSEFENGGEGAGTVATLQAELKQLRKENKRLELEREILKKAAAFFAKEQN
jgi:transposase